jgi:hypothetical protein
MKLLHSVSENKLKTFGGLDSKKDIAHSAIDDVEFFDDSVHFAAKEDTFSVQIKHKFVKIIKHIHNTCSL